MLNRLLVWERPKTDRPWEGVTVKGRKQSNEQGTQALFQKEVAIGRAFLAKKIAFYTLRRHRTGEFFFPRHYL